MELELRQVLRARLRIGAVRLGTRVSVAFVLALVVGCADGASRNDRGAREPGGADASLSDIEDGVPLEDAAPSSDSEPSRDASLDASQEAHEDAGGDSTGDASTSNELREDAMRALRAAIIPLDRGWRFRTDPRDEGRAASWAETGLDDTTWAVIDAGRTWEEQGFSDYDGVGWYRMRVDIPPDWVGSKVDFVASGVDDEYDLFINGTFIRHHGERPDRTMYQARTHSRIDEYLRFGQKNLIAVRVADWGGGGGLWRSVSLRRSVDLTPYAALLPRPHLPEHPEWEELYWAAWQMAFDKVSFGTAKNGFVEAFMDEGFNEQIYQWDTSFIVLFGRYGHRLFPAIESLDNFYRRQRQDGYIQRVYSETDGQEVEIPTEEEPVVNPPLFAWVEATYARFTGDTSRLPSVVPHLEAYFTWLEDHLRKPQGQGLYYQTGLGSGMDNTPRGDVHQAAWIDMSAQQALAALEIAHLHEMLDQGERAAFWKEKHAALQRQINTLLWSESDGIYYDLAADGHRAGVKHIGAFWPMLAEVATPHENERLISNLRSSDLFYRRHPFASLAATEPDYAPDGHYWRGGVWAPTNYMVIKGLTVAGHRDFAREATERHLAALAEVYLHPPSDASIAPEEQDSDYQTLWECYSPDVAAPGTRWDGHFLGRQDFVGWSGLGPIALLIEDILGLEVEGSDQRVVWHLGTLEAQGVEKLPVGNYSVDLNMDARTAPTDPVVLHVRTDGPFTLSVEDSAGSLASLSVPAGAHDFTVQPR